MYIILKFMYIILKFMYIISIGSGPYWFQHTNNLKNLLEQKGAATLFITYSMADLYWPDLHNLLGTEFKTQAEKRKAVNDNPHIVMSYFIKRLRDWNKAFLSDCLDQEWSWLRYENQHRGTIHAHMMCKLKNDPDLIKLCANAYYGEQAAKELENNDATNLDVNKLNELINIGKKSRKQVIKYVDTLITTINPLDTDSMDQFTTAKGVNHVCCKRIDELNDEELNKDYAELVNSVQRHRGCTSYCKRYKNGREICRFGFPLNDAVQPTTTLDFEDKKDGSFKVILTTKRNDPRMNKHCRCQSANFRSNVDMQIVLDWTACVNYIAKYAAKAETKSETIQEILGKVTDKLTDGDSVHKAFRSMMIATLGKRDQSHQEAVHLLMARNYPLVECPKFEFININLNNKPRLIRFSKI